MARILAISSQVARGTVGLSAIVPALQRLGHDVLTVPTAILSSHPAPGIQLFGFNLSKEKILGLVHALDANGWLDGVDGLVTGYLPSPDAVLAARLAVEMVRDRSSRAVVLVDPVLGDDPKGLYIDGAAAADIRDRLLPLADLVTPNRFELAWLTGRNVRDTTEAARALECLPCGGGVATSIPASDADHLANVLSLGDHLALTNVAVRAGAPHGTGDLMSAVLLSALTRGLRSREALAIATSSVDAVLAASCGGDRLAIAALPLEPEPWPVENWGR